MDRRYFRSATDFLVGVVLGGVATNLLVNISTSGGEEMSKFLLCPVGDTLCASWHIFLCTIIVCATIALLALIFNIIWWLSVIGKIKAYATNIGETSLDATITIISGSSRVNIYDLSIRPIRIGVIAKRIDVVRDAEKYFFSKGNTISKRIGQITITLAEIVVDEENQWPTIKFNLGEKGWFNKAFYFPYETDKPSHGILKSNLYSAIYDVVLEISGKIGSGQFTKLYRGCLLQFINLTSSDKIEGTIQWMKPGLYPLKKFTEEEKFKKFDPNKVLTREDFDTFLFGEYHKDENLKSPAN